MRVLVVEDEPRLADAIAEWLRQEAHAVDIAHDGLHSFPTRRSSDLKSVV